MASLAKTAGIELDVQLQADHPFIEGDAFALERVYRNLILNAIEATMPGGVVTLSTAEEEGVSSSVWATQEPVSRTTASRTSSTRRYRRDGRRPG